MKTKILITALMAILVGSSAFAQTPATTTAMNSTLVPQAWSSLPIVRAQHVKGGIHELGSQNMSVGATSAITAALLPSQRRTNGMVVAVFDSNEGGLYKQYILLSGATDADALPAVDDGDVTNDVWAEIAVLQAHSTTTTYDAGDPVIWNNATYFAKADGTTGAFNANDWYGISSDGAADLSSVTTSGDITVGGDLIVDGETISTVVAAGDITTTIGDLMTANDNDNSVVTAAALIDYVEAQLGGSVQGGDTENQILTWNNTTNQWQRSTGITIDRTTGAITITNAAGDITTAGDVSAVNVDASGALTGTTLGVGTNNTELTVDATGNLNTSGNITTTGTANANVLNVGAGNFDVDASGNVDAEGTVNANGLITAEGGLTVSDTEGFTLGGTTVDGIVTDLSAGAGADSLVTADAVRDALREIDAQVGDGTADQTLRWDDVTGAWVASGSLTNDGTDVTATGTVNAAALSTGEFGVDVDGNVTTTGTLNADGQVDLAASTIATNVHGTLTVAEAANMQSTLTATDLITANGGLTVTDGQNLTVNTVAINEVATTTAADGILDHDNDNTVATTGAIIDYVEDQLGTGGSLYYGAGSYGPPSAGFNFATSSTGSALKGAVSDLNPNINDNQYYWVAVPSKWGALNMFIQYSPVMDGFRKSTVIGADGEEYFVYALQFQVDTGDASVINLTFAID